MTPETGYVTQRTQHSVHNMSAEVTEALKEYLRFHSPMRCLFTVVPNQYWVKVWRQLPVSVAYAAYTVHAKTRSVMPPLQKEYKSIMPQVRSHPGLYMLTDTPPSNQVIKLVPNCKPPNMASMSIVVQVICFILWVQLASASDDKWATLNASVNGLLYVAEPVSRPCFPIYNGRPVEVDEAACSAVRSNYTTNYFRDGITGAYQNLQSEVCLSDPADQCLLDNTVSPAGLPAPNSTCNQGSIPSYYVAVEGPADIVGVFRFAKRYRFPVSIKNSGHDYMMRNSQKGSIQLWVHNLKGLTHYDDFTPEGCYERVGRAMTVATGETTNDAFAFASAHGSMILGGYSPTIALSGGWVQGGGHSVLSPVYGLGVDRVVEFKIVTPDGVLRTANSCQNADLFRALRGGGGGTFGAVLEATHRVEPAIPIAVSSITLPGNATKDTAMSFVELQVRESLKWGQEGWGGHVAGLYLKYMNPLPVIANISDGAAAASESMRAATDFALSVGGTSVVEVLPDWLAVWNKHVLPGAINSAGNVRIFSNRLFPRDLFATEEGVSKVLGFIESLIDLGLDPRTVYVPLGSPFVANNTVGRPAGDSDDRGTSVHPGWYSALWHMGFNAGLHWNATYGERLQNLTALAEAGRLAVELAGPDKGAYFNEASPFLDDWRESFWGPNYDFLLETKRKYDPDGILKCWKCIGFEDADVASDRFKCQGKLQQDLDAELS
jgi:FAD/FMN-containing dehydrogenase